MPHPALERFQKDFASYERQRRDEEAYKRQSDLERKRVEVLERENKRWEQVEDYNQRLKDREEYGVMNQVMGAKRTANSNGYSPAHAASPTIPSRWSTTATPRGNDSSVWTKTPRSGAT